MSSPQQTRGFLCQNSMKKSSLLLVYIFFALLLISVGILAQDTSNNPDTSSDTDTVETIQALPSNYRIISATPVNVRISPSTVSRVVGVVQPASLVTVIEVVRGSLVNGNSNWYRIQLDSGETNAYVHSALLVPTQEDSQQAVVIDLPPDVIPSLNITAVGTVGAKPDIAIVQFGFQQVGSEAITTYNLTDTSVKEVMAALLELEIKPADVSQSSISLSTEDVFDPAGGGVTGEFVFRSQSTLTVIIRSLDKLDNVLTSALSNGANSITSVTMTKADTASLESDARQAAINKAVADADKLAQQLNLMVGQPLSINIVSLAIVVPHDLADAVRTGAVTRVPDSPGEIIATAEVQIEFAVQSR